MATPITNAINPSTNLLLPIAMTAQRTALCLLTLRVISFDPGAGALFGAELSQSLKVTGRNTAYPRNWARGFAISAASLAETSLYLE